MPITPKTPLFKDGIRTKNTLKILIFNI